MDEASSPPASASPMDIQHIMRLLPHRYPFLLIDRVLEVQPRERIVVLKNISMNEPQFQGHFPDFPLMPGVLIVEAIAQAGGALLLSEFPDRDDKLMVFTGIDGAKFRRPVVPGDQLRIEVKVLNWRSRAVKMQGTATVDGKIACEATVMCQLIPRPGHVPTSTATPPSGSSAPPANGSAAHSPSNTDAASARPAVSPDLSAASAQAASAPLAGDACQPSPLTESNAMPEAAV